MFFFSCVTVLGVSVTLVMTFCATRWHCKRGKNEKEVLFETLTGLREFLFFVLIFLFLSYSRYCLRQWSFTSTRGPSVLQNQHSFINLSSFLHLWKKVDTKSANCTLGYHRGKWDKCLLINLMKMNMSALGDPVNHGVVQGEY